MPDETYSDGAVTMDNLSLEVRKMVEALVAACRTVFGDHLKCVVVKGSLVKGDFIPGYSDLDLHAFVDPEMLMSDRTPKLEYALRFQEAIGKLEPRQLDASQFQIYFLRADRTMEDWTPPVPGSYVVVYGTPPPAVLDWEGYDYVGRAKRGLAQIRADRRNLIDRALDKPDRVFSAFVRLGGTFVKGHAYSAAVVASGDPRRALTMRTAELLVYLEQVDSSLSAVRRFFDAVAEWRTIEREPDAARDAFRRSMEALEALERWAEPYILGAPE